MFITKKLPLVAVGVFGVFAVMPMSLQAASCSFIRDLQNGSVGEDVRCLQQYLNGAGFTITSSGGGSTGNETTEFKSLTETALIKWQQSKNIAPATGAFGPKSRAAYTAHVGGTPAVLGASTSTGISNASLIVQIAELKAQLVGAIIAPNSGPVKNVDAAAESDIKDLIVDALDAIEDAQDEIDDSDDTDEAEDNLRDARDYFYSALRVYLNGKLDKAKDLLDDAKSAAEDAVDALGTSLKDIEKRLDNARDDLDDAWDDVDDAIDNDDKVGDAEDYLDEADDLLDDAEDAIDEDDLNEAKDLIEEALDLIDDALDEL